MAALLRPCPAPASSPRPLLASARPPRSSSSSSSNLPLPLPLPPPLGGRITLKARSGGHGIIVRARDAAARGHPAVSTEDLDEIDDGVRNEFHEERDRIDEYHMKISNTSTLHCEATSLSCYLCTIAKNAVRLASIVMAESVDLRPGMPDTISLDTPFPTILATRMKREKQLLQRYVSNFVSTAEDAYHKKVTRETIASFLGALERVAATSYFMVQDTLAIVGDSKVTSLDCSPDCDVAIARREYKRSMDNLNHKFKTAPRPNDTNEIFRTTVTDAIKLTQPFVLMMTGCRKNALLKALSQVPPDDGEPEK